MQATISKAPLISLSNPRRERSRDYRVYIKVKHLQYLCIQTPDFHYVCYENRIGTLTASRFISREFSKFSLDYKYNLKLLRLTYKPVHVFCDSVPIKL